MKKQARNILSLVLAFLLVSSLCSCAGDADKSENGSRTWYLGGNRFIGEDINVEEVLGDYKDTIDPAKIYASLELTADMIHGAYTLNNIEEDLKSVQKDIPFEAVELKRGTTNLSILPTAVYLGADNICSAATKYSYSEFRAITDHEVGVIEFATEDSVALIPCIYELHDGAITFKQISQTNAANQPFAYEFTGLEFTFDFQLSGPYMTFSKAEHSLQLMAYCLTENADDDLSMHGYSLPASPLVADVDYFATSSMWNYAVARDGKYYDMAAYKLDDAGRFTMYLEEYHADSGETEIATLQYAYIIQSDAGSLFDDFSVILLDESKVYYYTDDVTEREARSLADQGADVNQLTEEEIKEIAEKKADLFDDLYKEFEAKGINVTINRSTGEIAMDASVLFGGDSAVITADGKALLNTFLQAYTSIIYNEKYDGFISKTLVEGHTAPVAGSTYESGLPLSQERAKNVKDYCLSSDTGVDTTKLAATLEATGLSNSKPVYGSDGEIDMAACRRVSFRFIVNVDKK